MPRRVQVLVHHHAAAAVGLDAQQLAQRRGLHPGRPQRHHSVDALVADHHIARLHVGHNRSGAHLHTQRLQLLKRPSPQVRRIRSQNVARSLEDQHLRLDGSIWRKSFVI